MMIYQTLQISLNSPVKQPGLDYMMDQEVMMVYGYGEMEINVNIHHLEHVLIIGELH